MIVSRQSKYISISGSATKKVNAVRCLTYCILFEYFIKGLEKVFGRVNSSDLALDIRVMVRIMKLLKKIGVDHLRDDEEIGFTTFNLGKEKDIS